MNETTAVTTPRILCVDDEPYNLDLYEVELESHGFAISRAENGAEALLKVSQERIDLVLLDVMMPDMDGYEVCRTLKNDPASQDIPVVMITALKDHGSYAKGVQAGTRLFLVKPIHNAFLVLRINFFLGRSFLNPGSFTNPLTGIG